MKIARESENQYTAVPKHEIIERFFGGMTINDLTNYASCKEGSKKIVAMAYVEQTIYESMVKRPTKKP